MLKSQKNCNVYKNYYQIGEKVLINNNIINFSYKTLKKNNEKLGLYNITAKIIKITGRKL